MNVEFRGWKRDHGPRSVLAEDVADAAIHDSGKSYSKQQMYVEYKSDGDVVLKGFAGGLSLTGDYQLVLRFTKEDVIALAKLALMDASFGEIVKALASSKKKLAA